MITLSPMSRASPRSARSVAVQEHLDLEAASNDPADRVVALGVPVHIKRLCANVHVDELVANTGGAPLAALVEARA